MAVKVKTEKHRYSQALSDQSSIYTRVLSVGYSKVGKTHFALTFPNPVIANADAGLATNIPVNCPVDPCVFNFVRWNEDLKEDELWSWTDLMQLVRELKYKEGNFWNEIKSYGYDPKTLIIDSGTTFCDLFAYEITKEDRHAEKDGTHMETLQMSDYNLIGQRMFNILDMIKTLPMHVVMTCELADKQDKLQHRYQQPAMVGQALGNRLPHYFDEVYIHYTEIEKDDSTHFYLTPMQTRGFEHAGSRKGIPLKPHENPSFKSFEKYYVKKSKQ
jgi:hypothetical protein